MLTKKNARTPDSKYHEFTELLKEYREAVQNMTLAQMGERGFGSVEDAQMAEDQAEAELLALLVQEGW